MASSGDTNFYDEEYLRRSLYNDAAMAALRSAHSEAHRQGSHELDVRAVLIGVLSDRDDVAARMVRQMGVSPERLDSAIRSIPRNSTAAPAPIDAREGRAQKALRLAPEVQEVFQLATDEAMRVYSDPRYVGSEHLLLGIIRVDTVEIGTILRQATITLERARRARDAVLSLPPQ